MTSRFKVLHVRVPVELVKAIDHYAIEKEIRRPEALARLVRKGIEAVIREEGGSATCSRASIPAGAGVAGSKVLEVGNPRFGTTGDPSGDRSVACTQGRRHPCP